jgi:hypothetical protein
MNSYLLIEILPMVLNLFGFKLGEAAEGQGDNESAYDGDGQTERWTMDMLRYFKL